MNDNIIYLPINVAWEFRAEWAGHGGMEPKRTDLTMSRIEEGMKKGRFDPISATITELEKGILSEGKHRLIIAKKLGIKQIPIIINPERLDVTSKIYNQNIKDIKNGLYGKFIKENDDETFTVEDFVLRKKLKIKNDIVYWFNERTVYPGKWILSIPIIPIKDLRHEQLYFENITQLPDIDNIFKSPDYFYTAKGRTAEILYMSPMEYMELCTKRFWKSTLEEEIAGTFKLKVKKYANDMLKGNLFPLINIEYYKDGSIDQEGKHRAMAIQYLIDEGKIPEDTEIPVVIVEEI